MAVRRSLIVIGEEMAADAYDAPVDMLPQQIARDAEAKIEDALSGIAEDRAEESADRTVEGILAAFSARATKPSIPLPLPQLRDILGGDMEIGSLVGMLSGSGEGKTSMALQVIDHAASLGHPVVVLSADQSPDQIINQIVSQRTGIENTRIRNPDHDGARDRGLSRHPLRGSQAADQDTDVQRLLRHRGTSRRLRQASADLASKKSAMPPLVVLDHVRKVKPNNDRDHEGRIAANMNGAFKQAAREMDLVWFSLMQRSSAGARRKNPRPIDSDIFGGEMGREDYDAVFYLYRAWKYWKNQRATAEDAREEGKIDDRFNREKWQEDEAELGVLKWRFGNPDQRYRVRFEAEFTRYVSKRPEPEMELFDAA